MNKQLRYRFSVNAPYRRAVALFGLFCLLMNSLPALAQTAPEAPAPTTTPYHADLDLSSTTANLAAPSKLGDQSVTINVGGTDKVINAASVLTPGERVAVWQMLNSGTQSIQLGVQGNAVGGSFTIGAWGQNLSNLVVPQGVTSNNTQAVVNIAGDLNNLGTLNILNSVGAAGATFNANNIFNGVGAVINSAVALNLNAVNNIVNAGQIMSAGNLSLVAGNTITNALPTGVAGAQPIMQAMGDLSLYSGAGSIVNSGMMSSINGNINMTTSQVHDLVVNSLGGTMNAVNGAINIREALNPNAVNTTVFGGDWLSHEINGYSGTGILDVDVNQATGATNLYAGEVHFGVQSGDLTIGNVCATGDPTFYNSAGNINLNGTLTYNASAAFLASGNIALTGNTALSTNNSGGSVTMISGASWTGPTGNNLTAGAVTGVTAGNNANTFTNITSSGGTINLTAFTFSLNTSSTTTNGGQVIIVGGDITLPAITINTGGANGFNNGNVTLIATTGNIVATGTDFNTNSGGSGNTGTGTITVASGAANMSGFSIAAGGAPVGTITTSSTGSGSIAVDLLTTRGADVHIYTGNNTITVDDIVTTSSTGKGGNVTITTNGNAGTITTQPITTSSTSGSHSAGTVTLTTTGTADITTSGFAITANATGGFTQPYSAPIIDITAGDALTVATGADAIVSNAVTSGNGGYIKLTIGRSGDIGNVTANGAGTGNGGRIDLTVTGTNTTQIGRTGAGNRIGLVQANAGTTGTGGTVLIDSTTNNAQISLREDISATNPIQVNAGSGASGGNGGIIGINVGTGVLLFNNASIQLEAIAAANGNASTDPLNLNGGNAIRIIAGEINGSTGNDIQASGDTGAGDTGNGGNISLEIAGGGANSDFGDVISSSGGGGGRAGKITITSDRSLTTDVIQATTRQATAFTPTDNLIYINITGNIGTGTDLVSANAVNGYTGLTVPTISINVTGSYTGTQNNAIASNATTAGNGGWIDVTFATSGGIGIIGADGAGTGNGGRVDVKITGATTTTIGGTAVANSMRGMSALAGTTGTGGTVLIDSSVGATPAALTLSATLGTTPIDVLAGSTSGNGGIIGINTGTAALTINSTVLLNANATASGNASTDPSNLNGGNAIKIDAGRLVGNANNQITATGGTGNGNGGNITITLVSTTLTSTLGPVISSSGSTGGTAGKIAITVSENTTFGGAITATSSSATAVTPTSNLISITSTDTGQLLFGTNAITANAVGGYGTLTVPTIIIYSDGQMSSTAAAAVTSNATTSGNGGWVELSIPSTTTGIGTIEADGAGTGNGGRVDFTIRTTATTIGGTAGLNAVGAITAHAGATSGNGGTVRLTGVNTALTFANAVATPINVAAAGANGTGGIIRIDTGTAALTFGTTTVLDVSGVGNGSASTDPNALNGGNAIYITANTISAVAANSILARGGQVAGNTGNGGNITIEMVSNVVPATLGPINSSSGVAGGRAGAITISHNDNITFNGNVTANSNQGTALNPGGNLISITTTTTGTMSLGTNQIIANTANGYTGLTAPTINIVSDGSFSGTNGTAAITSNSTAGNGGWISLTMPSTAAGVGNIQANGGGTGNGGRIDLSITTTATTIGGAAAANVVGVLSANAGTSGAGGTVLITTPNVNLSLANTASPISVTAAGAAGNGGIIGIDIGTGVLTMGAAATLVANAIGNGSASTDPSALNGGNAVRILAGSIAGASTNTISARGGSVAGNSGNGGSITVTLSGTGASSTFGAVTSQSAIAGGRGGNIDITGNTTTAFTLTTGALTSSGFSSTGAGTISLSNTGNLATTGAITATGLNTNIAGNAITVSGAQVQIGGNIDASGLGSGSGGTIGLTYNNAGTLTLGANTAPNFVNGVIKSTTGSGTAGNITISDTNASNMVVSLATAAAVTGTIESRQTGGSGTLGTISFAPAAGRSLSVTGIGANQGDLIGTVTASATTVTINPRLSGSVLTLGNITATAAGTPAISITNNNSATSTTTVLSTSTILANNAGAGNIDVNSSILNNNGAITSSNGSVLLHNSSTGGFRLDGTTSGSVSASTGITIRNDNNAAANTITLANSQTLNPGVGQNVVIDNTSGSTLGLTVTFAPAAGGQTITVSNGALNINTAPANANLTLTLDTTSNTSVTLTDTAASGINLTPNGNGTITFNTTSGSGTFNFNNAPVTLTAATAINVATNTTVQTNNTFTSTITAGTFTNNGTVRSTMTNGSITIQSPGSLAIAGTGILRADVGTLPYIWLNANSSGGAGANTLSITGNQTLEIAAGQAYVTAPGANAALTFGASSALTVNASTISGHGQPVLPFTYASYPYLNLSGRTITFGSGAAVTASGSAFITIDSGCSTCNLTIVAPTGGSATLTTANSMPIFVAPQNVNTNSILYSQSGVGSATLNVNGSFFSFTQCSTCTQTINSGVTLQTNNYMQFAVEAGGGLVNNGTARNSSGVGQLVVSNAWSGNLNLSGAGILDAPTVVLSTGGSGSIIATQTRYIGTVTVGGYSQGSISIISTSTANGLTVGGPILASNGSITIQAAGGALTVKTGARIQATEGNINIINTNTLAGASIVIGDIVGSATPTLIEAYTASNPALGNVNIYTGAFAQVAGSQPPNVTLVQTGGGIAYWGTNAITAVAPTNTVKVLNRNVTFARAAATPITINGSVTITADPPFTTPIVVTPPPPDAAAFIAAMFDPTVQPVWPVPPSAVGPALVVESTSAGIPVVAVVKAPVNFNLPAGINQIHSATTPLDKLGSVAGLFADQSVDPDLDSAIGDDEQNKKKRSAQVDSEPVTTGSTNPLREIGYISTTGTALRTSQFGGCTIKHMGAARLSQNETGLLELHSGEALVAAKEQTELKIHNYNLSVAPGAAVLIGKHGEHTIIRTVYNEGRHDVRLTLGEKEMTVGVGEEAVVSPRGVTFVADSGEKLGRRRVRTSNAPGNLSITRSEISMVSLLDNHPILSSLMHSNEKADKALTGQLMKMAACIMVATGSHGAYNSGIARK